jgi:hypothetical protein
MRVIFLLLPLLLPLPLSVHAEDLGEFSENPAGLSGLSGLFCLSGNLVSLVIQSANQMNETNRTTWINLFSVRQTR